ncbi:MAG: helix-turn-helix transcriptional regulator [Aquabacterium sp.]|jgi:transcriptional regulator with XRE-family HTH domain|uniref:helix-turn-helix domain-containing protein n=1 Tax=Aquabacterium sp. TaxID=1872578 RepID=UPI003BB18DBE
MNRLPITAAAPSPQTPPVGTLLRDWRQRRRLSQLDLALDTEVSARHLSFIETGRATPSRDMLLRLAERLDIPLRERNTMLMAAGHAPAYAERTLADPSMASAQRAVSLILQGHMPYPAIAVDSHWNLLQANPIAQVLMSSVDPSLLQGQVNVLRASLHPKGFAPDIVNGADWRAHLLARLHQQIEASGDPVLSALLDELRDYPVLAQEGTATHAPDDDLGGVAVPLRLRTPFGVLSFISTTTVFGTPVDITLSELALETFFPADEATQQALKALAATL